MIRLTSWEHADLIEYLRERPESWMANEDETLFLLNNSDGDSCVAVQITKPTNTGPFRLFALTVIHQEWSPEQADDYVNRILYKWTCYGTRLQVTQFLMDELKHDPDTAFAAAIGITRIFSSPDGGEDMFPVQGKLDSPTLPTRQYVFDSSNLHRTYQLVHGGYVKLALRGDYLAVDLSVPTSSGGFGHPLRGHVRPRFGSNRDEAAHLFGWETKGEHDGTNVDLGRGRDGGDSVPAEGDQRPPSGPEPGSGEVPGDAVDQVGGGGDDLRETR